MKFEHDDMMTNEGELYIRLSAYSERGWELVSVIYRGDEYNQPIILIFKRPSPVYKRIIKWLTEFRQSK